MIPQIKEKRCLAPREVRRFKAHKMSEFYAEK